MAAKTPKKKNRRGNITAEARKKGAVSKTQRGTFNRYLKALQGRAVERNRQKIEEIARMLESGTRIKKAPIFRDGRRVGTVEKELPLLPSERALWMARKQQLEANLTRRAPDELHKQFLEMLPDYAERNGLTREILITVGVPEADLDAAGL
ncbi:hypothetical protein KKF91_03075 [Myxococcota bacterium]|nr:hypothetical protein [Myxococcota bacterium]MBU1429523.1 hypothetical protein [Myxococcota bacterium]MBU1899891.1 hypothetical protein [Myxococcota bacterium]